MLRGTASESKRLLSDESGQAIVEYILLLSIIVVFATALTREILQRLDQGVLTMGGQLEKQLKAGRAPLDVWRN